jgi:hypothetical protein
MNGRREALAWEERWALPAALAAFAAIGFVIAAIVIVAQVVGGTGGDSELLRHVNEHRSAELISSVLQAIGVGLLAAPLYYLFRSAKARSERMRGQLVGIVIAAPLFLAVLAILSGVSTLHAASDFVSNEVPRLMAKGVALNSDRANEIAKETISEAPLRSLAAGFGLGGQLGFLVAMVYTCLYGMRVGLLSRFWGSLGMALGAVSFIFFQFAMLWFVYLGLLLIGRIPGGKPPAWESGEAIPWPSPGEKAAADLAPEAEGLPEADGDLPPPAEEEATSEKGQSQ